MKRDPRFLLGLGAVAVVVGYLVWTGVSSTMVYFLTPAELTLRVEEDPSFREVGVKVGARVVPGSYHRGEGPMDHRFRVRDIEASDVSFPVVYRDVLPDTFSDDVDVVLEGRLREDGTFEATTVLTKCGSRYEAMPEEDARQARLPLPDADPARLPEERAVPEEDAAHRLTPARGDRTARDPAGPYAPDPEA